MKKKLMNQILTNQKEILANQDNIERKQDWANELAWREIKNGNRSTNPTMPPPPPPKE